MSMVGVAAPEFTLPSHHGEQVRLSELRGRPVVLVFFPFAFTGVCTGELAALRDDLVPGLDGAADVLAVSCDSMYSLRAFADGHGLEFPLLSDFWPHGAVSSAYGVFDDDKGCASRGTFVLDRSGVIRWSVVNAIPEPRDVAAYKRVLGELTAA